MATTPHFTWSSGSSLTRYAATRTPDGRPWIATACQGEGADLWWPCKDHPSDKPETMDLRVTVPEGLFCASNGTLSSDRKNGDGTRTLHWHIASPISNYNVALNIAPYEELKVPFTSVTGEPIPFSFWVLPQDVEKGRKALAGFVRDLRFHEEVCGPVSVHPKKKDSHDHSSLFDAIRVECSERWRTQTKSLRGSRSESPSLRRSFCVKRPASKIWSIG